MILAGKVINSDFKVCHLVMTYDFSAGLLNRILFLRRGMGTPTFSSFNDVVRELEDVYGHQELWLYSGLNEDSPIETARRRQKWRSPKILKRNGRMVAEQSGQPDFWVLTGDYHLPQSEHSAPPWKACLINKVFKVYCSLLGKNT